MISLDSEQAVSNINAEEVTTALNGILTTDKFAASPQMSAFLKYVVEQTLIGNTRRIKAFTVGIEALGKPASFDPQTDPSVRVLAKRLRSSLDTYYTQNPNTRIFIEMKPGSYIPRFLLRSEMADSPAGTESPAHEQTSTLSANENQQPRTPTAEVETSSAETTTENNENQAELQSGINELWLSYKSASRVA